MDCKAYYLGTAFKGGRGGGGAVNLLIIIVILDFNMHPNIVNF